MLLSISGLQQVLKATLPSAGRDRLRSSLEQLQACSLRAAIREQGLWELQTHLAQIVPDIKKQYSTFDLDSQYLLLKARGMHAFQIALLNHAIDAVCSPNEGLTIVDIGDSAGTHIQYLQKLHKARSLRCLSINLDEEAVRKIQVKGLQALHMRAEDLTSHGINADIFISLEMLEHLENPVQFLKSVSEQTSCKAMVITVPYLEHSQVGLYHIRQGLLQPRTPERTHIFELCPDDWRLLILHAGWKVLQERLYLQYPRRGVFRLMKPMWKALDFEGFWGAVLVRDHTWKVLYRNNL